MEIPKIIHFVWAGGERQLPVENIKCLIEWKKRNLDFRILLWVDPTTCSEYGALLTQNLAALHAEYPGEYPEFTRLDAIFECHDIATLTQAPNKSAAVAVAQLAHDTALSPFDITLGTASHLEHKFGEIKKPSVSHSAHPQTGTSSTAGMLNAMVSQPAPDLSRVTSQERALTYTLARGEIARIATNFGVSSDLLRYLILHDYGGAYFDSDVFPKDRALNELPEFDGGLTGHHLFVDPDSQGQGLIGNDAFIVTTEQNPSMAYMLKVALCNYMGSSRDLPIERSSHLHTRDYRRYMTYFTDDTEERKNGTPFQTGPVVVRDVVGAINEGSSLGVTVHENLHQFTEGKTNENNWLIFTRQHDSFDTAFAAAVERIDFEMKELQLLRLPAHVNQIYNSLSKLRNAEEALEYTPENIMARLMEVVGNKFVQSDPALATINSIEYDFAFRGQIDTFFLQSGVNALDRSLLFPSASAAPNNTLLYAGFKAVHYLELIKAIDDIEKQDKKRQEEGQAGSPEEQEEQEAERAELVEKVNLCVTYCVNYYNVAMGKYKDAEGGYTALLQNQQEEFLDLRSLLFINPKNGS